MAESRRLVKVFLASPNDLSDERKSSKIVVDEFNALLAEEFGYQVELVGWEDTVSVFGRPQATINRELERCELFVGLMWKRWGTPPSVTGPYSSGFEEEFKRSVERRISDGRPEISLLFKEISPEFLRDPGDELKKVLDFQNQLIAAKTILFEKFIDIRDFEMKFRRCITTYIRKLRAEEQSKISGRSQAPTIEDEKQQTAKDGNDAVETPLSVEGAKFLREFIAKTERDNEREPIEGVEIARFRLLTSIVGSHGNDEYSLGVHDANLIFSKGNHFKLGRSELYGLVDSGLDHFNYKNVPLWHWFAAIDGFPKNDLPYYTLNGPIQRRVNALTAMQLISELVPSDATFNHDYFLNNWFAKDATSALRSAALSYLGEFGLSTDLTIIRQEIDRNDNQTINAANEVFIRINLRESRERAILSLYELQPTTINQSLLAALFDHEDTLSRDMLLDGVGHRNAAVRRIIVELLCKRRSLPINIAEQLLTDSDAAVRYSALTSLIESGRAYSDAEAKNILVTPSENRGSGVLSAILDSTGEDCWLQLRQQRLRSLKDKELEMVCAEDSFLDRVPSFILEERQFKQRSKDLRRAVDDRYKEQFDKWLRTMEEKYAWSADLLEKARGLEGYIRKDLTRKALDVICRKAEPQDLGLVREALKSGFVDYSSADVEYLRKFGEWEDIPLIIDSLKRPETRRSSLLSPLLNDNKYQIVARAIYALGQARLSELLVMQTPNQLLTCLIRITSDKAFRCLSDVSITLLFRSKDDEIRKSAALKCVRALPRRRIAKLLNDYLSGDEYRYYNVVHWLDFGISIPRERVSHAVKKAFKNN